jgi:hypothetical protein
MDRQTLNKLRRQAGYPPLATLETYIDAAMPIGTCYEQGTADGPRFGIPPERQRRHVANLAPTGTGKTVTAQRAAVKNALSTDGADIVVDPKGGFAAGFLPLLYHKQGHLDNVTVIEAGRAMPRLPLFDLRPYLREDVPIARARLAEIVINAGMSVLKASAVTEAGFEAASQSLELLHSLLTAAFRSGDDYVSFEVLLSLLDDVVDDQLTLSTGQAVFDAYLGAAAGDDERTRKAVVGGARRRLAPLIRDPLLVDACGIPPADPTNQLSFAELLDEDRVVIFDTAGLNQTQRELLSRLIVSRAFVGARLRASTQQQDHPLANLYIDEAHVLGDSDVLLDPLSEGREFDLSLYLISQSLEQFSEPAQAEITTNVGTLFTAQASAGLGETLAGGNYTAREARQVADRIPSGEWLVSLRPPRGDPIPGPFVINAGTLPPIHPASDEYERLPASARDACQLAIADCYERSRSDPAVVTADLATASSTPQDQLARGLRHTLWCDGVELPPGVSYRDSQDRVACDTCGETFPVSFQAVVRAFEHCRPDADPSSVELPIVEIGLEGVTPRDVRHCDCTLRQVMVLRLIERVERRGIDRRAWDIRDETMRPLRSHVGLAGTDAKTALLETGYVSSQELRGDWLRLTDAGRAFLRELRGGADPPEPNPGDPYESPVHIRGVERAVTALKPLTTDSDSAVTTVERYWTTPTGKRIDVVGLDESGDPVVCVEVERDTNDLTTAVPDDADAMAACEPADTVWVVPNRALGHEIVRTLAAPPEGPSRLDLDREAVAAESTPLDRYDLDSPACSALVTFGTLDAATLADRLTV